MTDDRAVRLALEVAHLTAERDALRAAVERVEACRAMTEARVRALADDLAERSNILLRTREPLDEPTVAIAAAYGNFARRLRAALVGTP